MTEKTTPDKTSGTAPGVEMIPQAHGGALRRGGTGAGGRTTSALRRKLRNAGANRIKVIKEIADNPRESAQDRLRAVNMMLQHGLGSNMSMDEVRDKLRATVKLAEQWEGRVFVADEFIAELRIIWLTG